VVFIKTRSDCAALAQGNPMQNSRITPMKLIDHYRCHGLKDGRSGVFIVSPSRGFLVLILQRSACTSFVLEVRRQTVELRALARSGL
jgi:hypothetical protein